MYQDNKIAIIDWNSNLIKTNFFNRKLITAVENKQKKTTKKLIKLFMMISFINDKWFYILFNNERKKKQINTSLK